MGRRAGGRGDSAAGVVEKSKAAGRVLGQGVVSRTSPMESASSALADSGRASARVIWAAWPGSPTAANARRAVRHIANSRPRLASQRAPAGQAERLIMPVTGPAYTEEGDDRGIAKAVTLAAVGPTWAVTALHKYRNNYSIVIIEKPAELVNHLSGSFLAACHRKVTAVVWRLRGISGYSGGNDSLVSGDKNDNHKT